jgi:hypothetical protein
MEVVHKFLPQSLEMLILSDQGTGDVTLTTKNLMIAINSSND